MKKIYTLLSIVLTMAIIYACGQDEGISVSPEGTLALSINIDIEAESTGGRMMAVSTDDFKVTIFDDNDNEIVAYDPFSSAPATISLATGTYYAQASSNNAQNAAFDEPFYFGQSNNFVIDKEESSNISIDAELTNTQVSFVFSANVANDFDDYYGVATLSGTADALTFIKTETRSGYFVSGTDLEIETTLTYTKLDASVITETLNTVITNPLPKTHYKINIDASLVDGEIATVVNVDETVDEVDVNLTNATVQERLDGGETPLSIYNSDNSLLSELYGKAYQGGLIFYLNTSDGTGMVAAPSDQSQSAVWWNGSYTTTGATGTAIGTGNANTNAIVASQGTGSYAAQLCADLVLGGFSDWHLPSKEELNVLYPQRYAVGGFSNGVYWSSTEAVGFSQFASYYSLGNGISNLHDKNDTFSVRAVRAF